MGPKTCALVGHRPQTFPWQYDERDRRCIALKAVLSQQIAKLAAAGVTSFYSGADRGAETWAALAVLTLRWKRPGIELHCILPCEGQESAWAVPARALYQCILDQADSIEYVSRDYYDGCTLERDRRLVRSAGVLLAVYNGEWEGGTAAAVRCARKAGREIIVIDPVTRQVTRDARREIGP